MNAVCCRHLHEGVNSAVRVNDVAFSLHCVFASFLGLLQIALYEKGGQKVRAQYLTNVSRCSMGGKAYHCLLLDRKGPVQFEAGSTGDNAVCPRSGWDSWLQKKCLNMQRGVYFTCTWRMHAVKAELERSSVNFWVVQHALV